MSASTGVSESGGGGGENDLTAQSPPPNDFYSSPARRTDSLRRRELERDQSQSYSSSPFGAATVQLANSHAFALTSNSYTTRDSEQSVETLEMSSPPRRAAPSPSFTNRTNSDPPSPGSLTRRKAPPPLYIRKSLDRQSSLPQTDKIDTVNSRSNFEREMTKRASLPTQRVQDRYASTSQLTPAVPIDIPAPSESSTFAPRNYSNVGLGLPFSMSAAADLSSLGSSSISPPLQRTPSIHETSGDANRNRSGSIRSDGIMESPVTDRTALIGLGELATPRWTSAALERRWGNSPSDPSSMEYAQGTTRPEGVEGEGEEFDVLSSYGLEQYSELSSASTAYSDSPTAARPAQRASVAVARLLSTQPAVASLPGTITHAVHPSNLFPPAVQPHVPTPPRSASLQPSPVSISSRSSLGGANESPNGLVTEYDAANTAALAVANAALLSPENRRISSGSTTSGSSRRSSHGKSNSIDGKSSKHSRRASASKSGFAHLPPSPATISTGPHFSGPLVAPLVPSELTSPQTGSIAMGQSQSQPSTGPSRTPDHNRHSLHSYQHLGHQSSPSIIAASILRQTRDLVHDGVDVSSDSGASEAMRKLDGLGSSSSPRLSRSIVASANGSIVVRSRTTSRDAGTSPSYLSTHDAEEPPKRRTRASIGGTVGNDTRKSPSYTTSSSAASSPALGSTSPISLTATFSPSSAPPLPIGTSTSSISRRPSQASATSDIPFPSSSPFKRGSSSSTTAGASTSESRHSTSGTSLSSSIGGMAPARSGSAKVRRESAGSDISSSGSAVEPAIARSDHVDGNEAASIPPVPPLPKDYESYRPSTGTSGSSVANSPRFETTRQESESSSLVEGARSTRSVDTEMSQSSTSTGKTPPRKWSISGAFGKSKSPKPPTLQESLSYTDLSRVSSSPRPRLTSLSGHLSEPWSRRLTGSTNDIAGLASNSSVPRSPVTLSSSISRPTRVHQTTKSDKPFSSVVPRVRTSSMSSAGAASTTFRAITAPPSVVAISPGRSRSSLLSPRRTPSGIPFFSRKATTSTPSASPAVAEKTATSPEGRRSILGLNFLRSTASRREKEKPPASPTAVLKRAQLMRPNALSESASMSEFGAIRPSPSSSTASNLAARKRGQTLSGPDHSPSDARPSNLPPMQITALPATNLQRMGSLTSSASSSSLVNRAQLTPSKLNTPVRSLRGSETQKANLPTIAGSPSSYDAYGNANISAADDHPSKPNTPTKIPRLQYRTGVASPALTPRPTEVVSESVGPKARRSNQSQSTPDSTFASPVQVGEIFVQDFATQREPGLALGERSLATRRRQASADSQIPRSRSTTASSASLRLAREDSLNPRVALPRSTLADDTVAPTGPDVSSRGTPGQLRSSLSRLPTAVSESNLSISAARRTLGKSSEGSVLPAVRRTRTLSATPGEPVSSARILRAIPSKMAPPLRTSRTNTPSMSPAPSDSSRSVSAASQYPSNVSEEELRGDEEMAAYVRRQQTKKLAAGMSADMIRKMFEFPDPTTPLPVLNCHDAFALYARSLTEYEKVEIKEFDKIYFAGQNITKLHASKIAPLNNHGYDDDRGDYLLVPHDHILYRYEVIDVLGKGSFGQVLQCRDHCTGEMVAIKIIRNKKRFHHQALIEIKVLENLVKWDPDEKHYVIRMVDSFTFRSHLCIVTELLSINLYELVKANGFAGFSTALIRRFTVQILGSLSLLRHHRVVHCDLKPENILLKHPAKSAIKVIDFGSSCFEHEKVYTYIQSRFYRSPEVILGMNYHMAIDMWSLGCILAEMFTGYPIFPGENEQEQLACIMEVLGLPDKYLVDRSSRKKLFFDSTGVPRPVVNSKGRRRRPGAKTLSQVLKCDDELFVDFIAKCLVWDPDRRFKPDSAMRHPWMASARARSLHTVIPLRTPRSSSSSTATSNSVISAPRRKIGSTATSTTTTPTSGAGTISQSARISSRITAAGPTVAPPPSRLQSNASTGLPNSRRYTVKSGI